MRRRRNRSTWFPILGFEASAGTFTTVDIRELNVQGNGDHTVTVVPIIQDIDQGTVDPSTTLVKSSLRDIVEGQTCIIDRIVGKIVVERDFRAEAATDPAVVICCAAIAVIPSQGSGEGDPAISTSELDPLNPGNSSNPWLWRRTWVLGTQDSTQVGGQNGLPPHNYSGSVAEGSHIDTKGSKRAIRREERIFLIYSLHAAFPDVEATTIVNGVRAYADLRVVGRMVKARNRGAFG